MKGHLKLLKSLDNKLNAAYASAQKSFAGRVLLKLTSEVSIDFANPQIESNASANGRYNYYGEIQETGRYGMWNYYLFGTLPYGFDDDSAINLLMLTAFDDSPNQNQVEILRKTAKPNTFAIIASDYYDHISLLPISDEWENIYHLLIRAQSD